MKLFAVIRNPVVDSLNRIQQSIKVLAIHNTNQIIKMAHVDAPERVRLDPLEVVKDYAAVPRLEYR